MAKNFVYSTSNSTACCREIRLALADDGRIERVEFIGGCEGNHQGLATLLAGQNAANVADRLQGIDCDGRGTSCPDQLAQALRAALET